MVVSRPMPARCAPRVAAAAVDAGFQDGTVDVASAVASVRACDPVGNGSLRLNALRRRIGISQKVLTSTLRGLERDGYVTRAVTPTKPPRVGYDLTDMGREALGPVRALAG